MKAWLLRQYQSAAARAAAGTLPVAAQRALDGVHLLVVLARESARDRLSQRAAMLSYWSVMAIVPLLLLGFAMTGPLGLADSTADAARALLYNTVLNDSVEELGSALDALLAAANLRTFGLVGVAGLLLSGSQLYFKVELAYNDIWDVRIRRGSMLRFMVFYALLTLGPLVLTWGLLAAAGSGHFSAFSRALPILLTGAGFVGAIRLLPNTAVHWRSAFAGGLLSAALFELAKFGFGVYATIFGAKDALARAFGSVALLPFTMIWLFVVWWVVLFGVELAYVLQHLRWMLTAQQLAARDPDGQPRSPDGFFAIALLTVIASGYAEGNGPMDVDALSRRCRVSPHAVQAALDVLEDAGLVVLCGGDAYMPARPPETILASEVLHAWRTRAGMHLRSDDPVAGPIEARLKMAEQTLAVSVASLGTTSEGEKA